MSTKEFGCFFCSGKSKDFNGTCDTCGKSINIGDQFLKLTIDDYTITEIIGRGFYGWTLLGQDDLQSFAIKIVPSLRYPAGTQLTDRESQALVKCSPHRNLAKFIRGFDTKLVIHDNEVNVRCKVFDYIQNSIPLSAFLEKVKPRLGRLDVVAILTGIASGLARMHSRDHWHNDLHDDNILIRTVEPDENLEEKYEAKLIDFGSSRAISPDEPEKGDRGDYAYLAKHIYSLVALFEQENLEKLTPSDRAFAIQLRKLAQRYADPNISRRNVAPGDVTREIKAALSECNTGHRLPKFTEMLTETKLSFEDPLGNTNALTLKPQDIALLFTDELGWESQMEKSEPVVVVGPRGCGKTMLLRHLSVESQARPRKDERSPASVARRLEALPHIGFLISCGELRTPFLRSQYKRLEEKDVAVAEDFCRDFISTQFALEILQTVMWLRDEKLMPISQTDLVPLFSTIRQLTGFPSEQADDHSLIEQLERRSISLSNLVDLEHYKPSNLCRDDALIQLGIALKSIPSLGGKEIWFLLDDYSVSVLTTFVQSAYNPVLFRLSSEIRLKVSSEGEGPHLEDTFRRKYREGRELTKVNLGEIYFRATEKRGKKFIEAIIDARYSQTGKGSLAELKRALGEHPEEQGFGKYILGSHVRPGDARFYGFGLLCSLCSGDVSYILELFRQICGGQFQNRPDKVADTEQDRITKSFAQRQLADLRRVAEFGPQLYLIAQAIGNLLKSYILESGKKEKKKVDERLRIEIEGERELGQRAQQVHDMLLRHSVLVYGGAGKSRVGLPTRKYFFRRLFAPCFPFSPSRKGCVSLNIDHYENWLLRPASIPVRPIEENPDLWEKNSGKEKPKT